MQVALSRLPHNGHNLAILDFSCAENGVNDSADNLKFSDCSGIRQQFGVPIGAPLVGSNGPRTNGEGGLNGCFFAAIGGRRVAPRWKG
jgi:hypothetical protein